MKEECVMNWNGKVINFLGDSITQGVGASSKETNYVSQTGEILNLAAANNYGISATRIAPRKISMDPKIDSRWFATRVPEMDPDADGIVVFGGTNDFGHGDAPLGAMSDTTEDTFYGAMKILCEKLIEKYPGKPIVILTPLHRSSEDQILGDGGNKMPLGQPLSAFAQAEREVAAYYSLPVLDLWSMSGLQPKVPVIKEKYMPDGLHPSDAGHRLIAERLSAFLNAL